MEASLDKLETHSKSLFMGNKNWKHSSFLGPHGQGEAFHANASPPSTNEVVEKGV